MSRRLSAIRFAARLRDTPDPTANARVIAVWEGIRRTPRRPARTGRAADAPELFDVLAALRRSELAAVQVSHVAEHPNGAVLTLPRSKTNQTGEQTELVVLPRAGNPTRCPVTTLQHWLTAAGITDGPVLRPVSTGNRPQPRPLHPESVNTLIQNAVARAGLNPTPFSAHSLRAGFVTYAPLRGATDRAIAHQTRHRSLATLGGYVRIRTAWTDNAATQLGL